jgi:hypothetical protein
VLFNIPAALESKMLFALQLARQQRWGCSSSGPPSLSSNVSAQIVRRRLRVGLHGGRCLLTPSQVLVLKANANGESIQLDSGTQLVDLVTTGFWEHQPTIALLFELEYTVSFGPAASAPKEDYSDEVAVDPSLTTTIAVGHTVRLLFAPNTADQNASNPLLLDGSPSTIPLRRGPGRTLCGSLLVLGRALPEPTPMVRCLMGFVSTFQFFSILVVA